jgi:cysteine desulfurase
VLDAAAACVSCGDIGDDDADATSGELTQRAWNGIEAVPGVARYGDPDDRLGNILCFGVEGVEAEPILLALDQRGIALHSGSSCSSETLEPSPVLQAMGVDAEHSLRLSVGWSTTVDDIDRFVGVFPGVVAALRDLRT